MKRKELALAYCPNVTLRTAYDNLHRWIERNAELRTALFNNGFSYTSKELTPLQVRLIYHYLGEPE